MVIDLAASIESAVNTGRPLELSAATITADSVDPE